MRSDRGREERTRGNRLLSPCLTSHISTPAGADEHAIDRKPGPAVESNRSAHDKAYVS